MERKKRSKGSVWEFCYANKIFWTFGFEIKACGQKLVTFCAHTHTHTHAAKLVVEIIICIVLQEDSDEPIQNSEHVQVDAEHGALNFRPVNNAHRGKYTCVAINDVGRDEMEGELTVIGESPHQIVRNYFCLCIILSLTFSFVNESIPYRREPYRRVPVRRRSVKTRTALIDEFNSE